MKASLEASWRGERSLTFMENLIRVRSWKRRIQTRIFLRSISGFSYSAPIRSS